MATVDDCSLIQISHADTKCSKDLLRNNTIQIPFPVKRVFFSYDIPEGMSRGGHSHIQCHQLLIAARGSFAVILDDGKTRRRVLLDNPDNGIYIPPGIWAHEQDFIPGTVCLVFASHWYEESDYIRDYTDFIKSIK